MKNLNLLRRLWMLPLLCFALNGCAQSTETTDAQSTGVKDFLKTGNTLQFNNENFYLGWSSNPASAYYTQEYFPKGEKPESYHQMFTVTVLFNEEVTPKAAVDAKVAELDLRKMTDACCNYKVVHNDDYYLIDFLVSQKNEKDPELLSIVEFDVHVYRQVVINGRKALKLDLYSHRVYDEEIMPFLYNLTDTRKKTIAEMIKTDIQCH